MERQQLLSALSPTLPGLTPLQPNTNNDAVAVDVPSSPQLKLHSPPPAVSDEKVKKIARVPVQVQSPAPVSAIIPKTNEKENDTPIDALIKATTAAALSQHETPKTKALVDNKKPATATATATTRKCTYEEEK